MNKTLANPLEEKTVKSVLITDDVHELLLEGLEAMGYQCDYQPNIELATVRNIISSYEGLIINSKITVDQLMLDHAERLKFIGRLGSGMEIVDQAYAGQKGIAVLSAPEGNRNAVAEHALGMLLALFNHFNKADTEVRNFSWNREANRGVELMGKTVGIIGFGHTGSQFAKKLSGMGVKILAFDKYKQNYTTEFPYVEEVSMTSIFEQADVVSLHLPLTKETHYLAQETWFNQFKKSITLLNTSRGKVVALADLLKAIESGKVKGAGLDVFENEKPSTFTLAERTLYQKLYRLENVLLTPHVAGWTVESKERLASVLLEKISKVLIPSS